MRSNTPAFLSVIQIAFPFKGVFTHPVYACVFRIALHFSSTYVGSFISMERNIITLKTQYNAENAFVNGMWQLSFTLSWLEPLTCKCSLYTFFLNFKQTFSGMTRHSISYCSQATSIQNILNRFAST